jgi:hypothetical protein
MRKSSAIFVGAVALGLAMFVPVKASAQVTIYVNPGYPGYGAAYPGYGYYPAYPRAYGYSYPSYGMPIRATGMDMDITAPTTAAIGVITDALLAE